MLSVLDYAVNVLKVSTLLFVGIMGAVVLKLLWVMTLIGIINWIRHINVYRLHEHYLNSIEDQTERFNTFVEVNVKNRFMT
jgi:carbonic anhydrase